MSEWLKEHAWKACVRETVPWVRIPLSPPSFQSYPVSVRAYPSRKGVRASTIGEVSPAQWLVGGVCAALSIATYLLMRYRRYRREPFRGEPFALTTSLVASALMLALGVIFVWAQGRFEGR
jgi:hypothetical protein